MREARVETIIGELRKEAVGEGISSSGEKVSGQSPAESKRERMSEEEPGLTRGNA